jgi:hypothetical protein
MVHRLQRSLAVQMELTVASPARVAAQAARAARLAEPGEPIANQEGRGGHRSRPPAPRSTHSTIQGEFAMKRLTTAALSAILLSLVSAGVGLAQVKRVEMKIDGYLCGN